MPIRCSRSTPVIRIVASFASVILPSGLIVTSGFRLASIRLREYCAAKLAWLRARSDSVTLWAIDDAPMIPPAASLTGETVSETAMVVPSFFSRVVS